MTGLLLDSGTMYTTAVLGVAIRLWIDDTMATYWQLG